MPKRLSEAWPCTMTPLPGPLGGLTDVRGVIAELSIKSGVTGDATLTVQAAKRYFQGFTFSRILMASSKGTLPMSELDQPAAISQRERDEDLEVSGRGGGWLPGPSAPEEVLVPARRVPWLTESSPQAWDSYASAGGPDYQIADCGSPESHERRLRALLQLPIEEGDTLLEFGCGTGRLADFGHLAACAMRAWTGPGRLLRWPRRRRPHGAFHAAEVWVIFVPRWHWVVASGTIPTMPRDGRRARRRKPSPRCGRQAVRGFKRSPCCAFPLTDGCGYDGGELISFLYGGLRLVARGGPRSVLSSERHVPAGVARTMRQIPHKERSEGGPWLTRW